MGSSKNNWSSPLVITAAATLVRLLLACTVPLVPDETYYWEWSRHLATGYFDHPPLIALCIRLGTTIFGDTRIGVRIGAIIAGAIATWAIVTLVRRWRTDTPDATPATSRAAVLIATIPLSVVGFTLATPDAPLLAAVAMLLLLVDRALAAPARSAVAFRRWCTAGVALGLALCSKYTAVLVALGIFIGLLAHPRLRRRLAEPGPYVAVVIALAIFSPVIIWNARHGWVSFAFQLHHGLGRHGGSPLARELNLFGGQLALITPIIAILMGMAVWRAVRDRNDLRADHQFVWGMTVIALFAVFALSAVRKPVEANWPAPALAAMIPLLAMADTAIPRRWFTGGVWLAGFCAVIISAHAMAGILPLPPRRDPLTQARGWDDAATRMHAVRDSLVRNDPTNGAHCHRVWFTADRYQDASALAFALPDHPFVFALNIGGRHNQYDLWPPVAASFASGDCVLLAVDDSPAGAAVAKRASQIMAMLSGASDPQQATPFDAGIAPRQYHGHNIGARRLWDIPIGR